jgi:hypothetical protein
MMHGHEKSDPAIVAMKPANKAERSAAELVERRAGTKGNADWQSTHWTPEVPSQRAANCENARILPDLTPPNPICGCSSVLLRN